ncbi:MAG: hypothetical protein Q8R37_04400 [Nanoarchaeota archaeon]|nr:hypothetical protein [Nanoarchaeota archaeon]
MHYKEAPTIKIEEFTVFPYAIFEDAKNSVYDAQEHFDQMFRVRNFHEGYILVSDTRVLDARGFVVDKQMLKISQSVETFYNILRDSSVRNT